MTRSFYKTLLLFLLCISLAPRFTRADLNTIELVTRDSNRTKVPIFSSGQLYSEWDTIQLPCTACNGPDLIIEQSRFSDRSFEISNNGTAPITVSNMNLKVNNSAVISPSSNFSAAKTLSPSETVIYTVEYNCNNSTILEQDLDGWSYIEIGFTVDGEPVNFNYLKVCTMENRSGSDYSIYVILVIACLVVAFATRQKKTLLGDQAQHMDEIQPMHAVFFVVFASISLLTLYFFSQYIKDILSVIFIFYSLAGCSVLFMQWTERYAIYSAIWSKSYHVPWVGPVTLHNVACFAVALGIVASWFITRTWYLNDVIGLSIVCLIFKVVKLPSLKVAYLLLGMAFFYDIFWVFISKPIFGESVMLVAATALDLPIKIEWPYFGASPVPRCSMLGLGDMVLPGFFITFNYKFGLYKKTNAYYLSSVISYAFGLALCIGFLIIMGMGQPALLYLVPSMLGAATAVSIKRGEFKEMWEGIPEEQEYKDLEHHDKVQMSEIHNN